jgi:hypothetical protein
LVVKIGSNKKVFHNFIFLSKPFTVKALGLSAHVGRRTNLRRRVDFNQRRTNGIVKPKPFS